MRIRLSRVAAALTVLAASMSMPALRAPQATAAGPQLRHVGDLPLRQNTVILPHAATGRLLVLPSDGGKDIDFYDPVSLKKTGSLSVAPYDIHNVSGNRPHVYAWSPGQARLFVMVYLPLPGGTFDRSQTKPFLATIDPVAAKVESVRPVSPAPFPPGVLLQGMSYYAPENRLYLLGMSAYAQPFAYVHDVFLTELDPATAAATWPEPFAVGSSCQKTVNSTRAAAVHRPRGSSTVYFGCGTGNLVLAKQPGTPAIAAVDVSGPRPTVRTLPISGSYALGSSYYDDTANRLVLLSAGANVPSQAAWVFDEAHEVVVGTIAAGTSNVLGAGIDEAGGRLYLAVQETLLVSFDRGLAIPQATRVPMPELLPDDVTPVRFARRLLVKVSLPSGTVTRVYEHDFPDYVEPLPEDPDAATADLPETPGITGTTFGADAKAYGARVHQVGGVNATLQNVISSNQDFWSISAGKYLGVNDSDRSAWFARTSQARLGEREATASAVTTDGDPATKVDYTRDYTKTPPPVSVSTTSTIPTVDGSRKWPYTPAECVDFGDDPATRPAPDATVTCNAGKAHVATAAAHENDNLLPIDVGASEALAFFGGSSSSTSLDRDSKRGVVVDAKAESRDIVLAGVVRIGKVTSRARSAAKGRPGTASASYERTIENVTTPSGQCGQCDPVEALAMINAALPSSMRAELPAHRIVATPRGARGAALREPWQHQQDIVMNNEGETDLETPGLRVTYYGDNANRSRVILDFAATQANSAYSVYRLASFDGDGDGSEQADLADLFAGSNIADAAADGTVVATEPTSTVGVKAPQSDGSGIGGLLRRLGHGLRLLLTGRRAVLLNAALWPLLTLPAFLVARRRYLLRLIGEPR